MQGNDVVRRLRGLTGLLMFLMCIGSASAAFGQTTADRQASLDLVRQGNEHYDAGEFRDAIRLYKQAHRELGDDRLLYRIGLSYEYVNNVIRAREYLTAFLEADPQTPFAGRIAAKIERLDTIEETVQSYLAVSSEPAGATVYLNGDLGSPEGKTPLTVPVGPGEHLITLVFEDRRRIEEAVSVNAGQTFEHHIQVRAGAATVPEPEPAPEPAPEPEPTDVAVATAPVDTPIAPRHRETLTEVSLTAPTWGLGLAWTGLIVGDLMIVGGILSNTLGDGTGGDELIIGGALLAVTGLYFLMFRNYTGKLDRIDVSGGLGASPDGTGVGFGLRLRY